MIKVTKVNELKIMHEHDYAGNARLLGKDVYGNDIDITIKARTIVDISREVLRQHGEMFPTIRVERIGSVGSIEITGDAGRLFDAVEKLLTLVKQ